MDTLHRLSQQLLQAITDNQDASKQCVYKSFLQDVRNAPSSHEFMCPDFQEGKREQQPHCILNSHWKNIIHYNIL